jgi:hypothetical protein
MRCLFSARRRTRRVDQKREPAKDKRRNEAQEFGPNDVRAPCLLLEPRGELVTREEIERRLWADRNVDVLGELSWLLNPTSLYTRAMSTFVNSDSGASSSSRAAGASGGCWSPSTSKSQTDQCSHTSANSGSDHGPCGFAARSGNHSDSERVRGQGWTRNARQSNGAGACTNRGTD